MILGDATRCMPGIATASSLAGVRTVHLVPGPGVRSIDDSHLEVDFSSRESLRACHQRIGGADRSRVGAIINLLGLDQPFSDAKSDHAFNPLPLALCLLHVVQEFSDDLRASSKEGGGWLLNVTTLDGRFGCAGSGALAVNQAGTLGICKALAREVPGLHVKNLDLAPDLESDRREILIIEELFADDSAKEVGHDHAGRWTIGAKIANPTTGELGPLPVDRNSVILVTGGAVGVTAAVAKELARQAGPRLILVGRSPPPVAEDAATSQQRDKASLRRHLIGELSRSGKELKPAEIEARVKRLLKDREILENIAAMRAAGSEVEYHAADVRDSGQLSVIVRQIYQTHGRLDGVIHGAGVLEDKLICDKTSDSFARVFSTKVESALTLVRSLRPESLKFLAFFSSVSARLGAVGQVDYGAANEVLNKLAARLGATWPGRVVAINWGPWHGGMVSEELLRQYTARNISTIGLAEGARQFVEELRISRKSTAEILIVAGDLESLAKAAAWTETSKVVATDTNINSVNHDA